MSAFVFRTLESVRAVATYAILLVPVFVFGGSGIEGATLIQFLAFAASLAFLTESCFFSRRARLRPFRSVTFNASLAGVLAFVAYAGLQWALGPAVFSGLPGTLSPARTLDNLLQLLVYLLIFFLFLRQFEERRSVRLAVFLLALQASALAVLGYYQKFVSTRPLKMYDRIDMSGYPAYFSSFLNSNHYGGYVVLVSASMTAWLVYYFGINRARRRLDTVTGQAVFFLAILPFLTASIFHSEARLAFAAQIGLLLLICLTLSVSWGRVRLVLLAVALIAVCAGVLRESHATWGTSGSLIKILKDWGGRLEIYQTAREMLKEHPWFGLGLGACRYALPLYQHWSPENVTNIHLLSRHLELAVETGAVGYLLFVGPLALLMAVWLRRCLANPSDFWSTFGLASWLTLLSVAALSLPEEYILTPSYAILCVFHLAVVGACALEKAGERSVLKFTPHPRINVWRFVIWTAGTAALVYGSVYTWQEWRAWKPVTDRSRDLPAVELSARLRPWVPEIWIWLGELYRDEALRLSKADQEWRPTGKKSILAYQEATRLAPTWPDAWIGLGRSKIFNLHRREGFRDIEHGASVAPYNRDYAFYLAVHYDALTDRTPWEDEKAAFREKALYWLSRCCRADLFAEPLRKSNIRYLKNFSEGLLDDEAKGRVKRMIGELEARGQKVLD